MVAVGKIHQALEGCACPMGVVAREFLKKLRLADDEVAIVDMEAGIEHFGRGVETSLDAVLVVVEPSLESVNLAQRVKELASGTGANFAGAVLNKIASEQLASTLIAELRNRHIPLLGTIRYHQEIVEACLTGQPLELTYGGDEAARIVDALLKG